MGGSRAPTTVDVHKGWQADTLRLCNNVRVGIVVSYTDPPSRVTVQLAQQGTDAIGTPKAIQPLADVPVAWPRWGLVTVRGRLNPGDVVVLLISDRALKRWLAAGGVTELESDRTHDLNDAIAVPMLAANPSAGAPSLDALTIATDAGVGLSIAYDGTNVTIEAPQVRLGVGAGPTDQVAIARAVHEYLTAMIAAGSAATVPTDGGEAALAAMTTFLGLAPYTDFAALKAVAEAP